MDLEREIQRAVIALWDAHRVENEALQRAGGAVARTAVLTGALVPLLRLMHDIQQPAKPGEKPEPSLTASDLKKAGLALVSSK